MPSGISFPSVRLTSYALRARLGGPALGTFLTADILIENSPAGTVIGTLSCAGVIGTPVFSLIDNAGGRVALSGNTVLAGLVNTNYETTPFFNFAVSVTGIDPQLPNTMFTVYVGDVAEFPPVIISNGGAPFATSINENTTAVTTIVATDADVGAGSSISYSIAGGADAAKFYIDPSSGALRFINPPDFETPASALGTNTYNVIVQASDGTFADTQTITVSVLDVFDPPAFLVLSAQPGNFVLAGQSAALGLGRGVQADVGAFVIAGQSAALTYSPLKLLQSGVGDFVLAGQSATLTYTQPANMILQAGTGTLVIAGDSMTTVTDYVLQAGTGAFVLAGQSATLSYGALKILQAGTGAFVLAGQNVTMTYARALQAGTGGFAIAGQNATLSYVAGYQGPGDVAGWSGAYAYWGLRAYNSTKIGANCIDVCSNQYSGGSPSASNLLTLVIGSDGYVDLSPVSYSPIYIDKIYDQIGTQHMVLGSVPFRSTLTAGIFGGKAALDSSPSIGNYYVTASPASPALAQPISVAIVSKIRMPWANAGVIGNNNSGSAAMQMYGTLASTARSFSAGSRLDTLGFTDGNGDAGVTVFNGSSSFLNVNGTGTTPQSVGTSGIVNTDTIIYNSISGGAAIWDGYIYEVLIKGFAANSTQVTAMQAKQHAIGTGF